MKKVFTVLAVYCMLQNIHAQISNQPDTAKKEISLGEIIISATNFSEKRKNIAQKTDVITAKTIALTNAQNKNEVKDTWTQDDQKHNC